MSLLSANDPARKLDIFKFYPDFDHSTLEIWSQEIMDYSAMRNLICHFDIETTPIKRLANGLIDFKHPSNKILAIRTRLNGIDKIFEGEEYQLLRNFIDYIDGYSTNIYVLTGHGIFDFDLPYILARCLFHEIGTAFMPTREWNGLLTEVKNSSRWGKPIQFLNILHPKFNIVDTLHLCAIADKREAKLSGYGLKYVCGPDGYDLRQDKRVELPGDQIAAIYESDRALFHEYLKDDIDDTELLVNFHLPSMYYLLKYIPNINLQKLVFSGNAQKWNIMLRDHYKGVHQETDQKVYIMGAITGIHSGVYRNCAKADVASLYPSIMLHQQIYSRKDPDKYQLKVLSVLKKRRLQLKHSANKHEAKFESNALKVLINSGYGALGTPYVQYNDMQAAATVTAYGRAVLDFMLSFLESKQANILQFDTDGIVFSHDTIPLDDIHKEMQEALPEWVEVELEARYDYVWIYKRKNYITYKGSKISGVGLVRKRDKSELYKRYLKYLPTLYINNGMESVDKFTSNVIEKLKTRSIPVHLLATTKKITEYKNNKTVSQIGIDLKASPGESVTFYVVDIIEEYITPKQKITKTRTRQGFKRLSDYDNDYSIGYYINEILEHKWSKAKECYTKSGWLYMFKDSIEHPIIEYSTGDNEE